ncbi:aminoacetone oxidase family FAD-binding enzyme [Candidatus Uhrbacteria bacterium]|nr:aminoacetone oxidase family FAD-binding enzyme [Candidatus Uhrbacteria bacterium]
MRTAIIGGGAAGLMATATLHAANPTAEIFLIDGNDGLGKKVIISGGGRCNVTTGIRDVRTVLMKYPRGAKFLSSAMHAFPPEAVMAWFESHGVPLKTEPDLRVFPKSDNGKDIVHVFERLFKTPDVHVLLKTRVVGIERRAGGGFLVRTNGSAAPLAVDTVVLTTGGQAYRQTGSTGDGYAFAMSLGHTLTPLAPGLNAFFTRETWPAEISGVSFERATITAHRAKKEPLTNSSSRAEQSGAERPPERSIGDFSTRSRDSLGRNDEIKNLQRYTFTGPFLFTHNGVSGPAVFALSSLVAFEPYDAAHPLDITIDLFPDETTDALAARIRASIAESPTKILPNVLAMVIPKSLAAICVRENNLPATQHVSEIGKKDIQRAVAWLKAIPLHVIQRGAGDEFVTAGGIPLTEVDPSTMESRVCPGLYFAGEILDIDGFTGGFNLQASWATGHLAGVSIAAHACITPPNPPSDLFAPG